MPAAHLRTHDQNVERARAYAWVGIILCAFSIGFLFLGSLLQWAALVASGLLVVLAVIFSACAAAVAAEIDPPRPIAPIVALVFSILLAVVFGVGAFVIADLNKHGVY